MAFFLKNGRPFRRVCSEKHHAHSLVLHCLHFFNLILKDRRDRSVLLRVVIASQDRHFFLKIEERKTKNKNVQRFKNFNLMRVHSINKQGTKCDFTHFFNTRSDWRFRDANNVQDIRCVLSAPIFPRLVTAFREWSTP